LVSGAAPDYDAAAHVRSLLKGLLWMSLVVGAIVGILRATCISFWTVPSDDPLFSLSVMPTLEAGDLLVLWRFGTPTFGDLVRCPDPEVAGKFVAGRLLGEQGDRIVAELGTVSINEKLVSSVRACKPAALSVIDPNTGEAFDLSCEIEEAGGTEYTRARATHPVALKPVPFHVTVPDRQIFIASDDRHYHDDSRDFGPVPKDGCHERILFRLWSARGWSDEDRRMMFIH
jgi:signal peptidase I